MAAQYFLSHGAFVCVRGGRHVLLDVRNGVYLHLSPALGAALSALVPGWPAVLRDSTADVDRQEVEEVITAMLDSGLLTEEAATGKDASPVHVPLASSDIAQQFPDQAPPLRWIHVRAFAKAVIIALLALRLLPLQGIVARIARRRAARASTMPPSAMELALLVFSYQRLRTLTFSARGHCFFDSLVLIEFLSQFDARPQWVFGVQDQPFVAHCWVQQNDVTLNETPFHAALFTPIMTA